jgi:hypothetical protein
MSCNWKGCWLDLCFYRSSACTTPPLICEKELLQSEYCRQNSNSSRSWQCSGRRKAQSRETSLHNVMMCQVLPTFLTTLPNVGREDGCWIYRGSNGYRLPWGYHGQSVKMSILLPSAEVESRFTSLLPHMPSWHGAQLSKHEDNFT